MQNVLEQGPNFWCWNSFFIQLCSPNIIKERKTLKKRTKSRDASAKKNKYKRSMDK